MFDVYYKNKEELGTCNMQTLPTFSIKQTNYKYFSGICPRSVSIEAGKISISYLVRGGPKSQQTSQPLSLLWVNIPISSCH